MDGDFGGFLGESFPGAQIEGDACPAPVVDVHAEGDKGFGVGLWIDPFFFAEGGDVAGSAILAEADRGVKVASFIGSERAEHFHFFVANGAGFESIRRFHGDEGN